MFVNLVDQNGVFLGKVSFEDAQRKEKNEGKDLVLINGKTNTYKIADSGKLKYEQKQKDKQNKAQKRSHKIKEIKLRPLIDKHDLEVKLNHIREFLQKGIKTKVIMVLRGREKSHKELAAEKFNEIPQTLIAEGLATADAPAQYDGGNFVIILSPVQK